MAKMNVELSPDTRMIVDEYVGRGEFATAVDVISAAVRFLKEEEDRFWDDVNERVAEAEVSVAEGRIAKGDSEFWARVRARVFVADG